MVWYYAESDRQRGPISDEEFQELVDKGRIRQETLVWKDGMDTWQPLSSAQEAGLVTTISPASPPSVPPVNTPAGTLGAADVPSIPSMTKPGLALCSQCGRGPLGPHDSVQLGNLLLCRSCDADMARHYRNNALQADSMGAQGRHSPAGFAAATALPFASIISRVAAKFIDNLLESMILLIVMALTTDMEMVVNVLKNYLQAPEEAIALMRPFLLGALIFRVLYDSILVGKFGATLGKMTLGIKVVNADGNAAGFSQAIIRGIAPAILQLPGIMMASDSILPMIGQFIFFFGYLIAIFDLQKRTLYDHLANTRVVQ